VGTVDAMVGNGTPAFTLGPKVKKITSTREMDDPETDDYLRQRRRDIRSGERRR
jgi:hypothetical protein